jgi:hypothetical protein
MIPSRGHSQNHLERPVVEKLERKHGVLVFEVEEVLSSKPLVRRVAKGRTKNQDVYSALGQTKKIDPLPESFESEQTAGEFWDTHSLTDYEEHLEAADDVTFEISERVFEVQVAEDIFKKLREQAALLHQPVPKVVDEILRKELP